MRFTCPWALPLGLSLALLPAICQPALGEATSRQISDEPNPFQKTYVNVELTRNYPMSYSQRQFGPGTWQPALSYLHDLDAHWLMGLGAQFKLMTRNAQGLAERPSDWMALWTLSHETLYALRLSHPNYLLVGPKLLYLYPAENAKLPLTRDPHFDAEIGAALTAQLVHLVGERSMLMLRVERWRGTKTTRFQSLELAIGGSILWN